MSGADAAPGRGARAGLGAGLLYGGLAFLAGAVLGPVRELALTPRLGGMAAALVEAVAMSVLLWLAARFTLDRALPSGAAQGAPPGAPGWRPRAAVAGVGLVVVLAAEAVLSWALAATGLAAQRATRSAAERAVGLPLLAWMALLPFFLRRRGTS